MFIEENMKHQKAPAKGEIVIYQTKGKEIQLEVKLEQGTVWLSQKQMGVLFQKNTRTINDLGSSS